MALRAAAAAAGVAASSRGATAGLGARLLAAPARGFHASQTRGAVDARPILRVNRADPPSAAALAAIVDARRAIFGMVEGNGKRSGRKVLRRNLYGPAVARYYERTFEDMKLDSVGVYAPAREELYRREEVNKRLGKTRIKGKVRGPTQSFVDRMKIEDAADGVLDQLDWVDPSAVIEDNAAVEDMLRSKLGLTETEMEHFLPRLNAAMMRHVEAGRRATETAAASAQSAADKKSKAREKSFRAGRDDKRPAKRSSDEAGGGAGESDAEEAAAAAAAAVPAPASSSPFGKPGGGAKIEDVALKLKPLLEQWRAKHGKTLEDRAKRQMAATRELLFHNAAAGSPGSEGEGRGRT